jgi:hypothetical protein
MINSLKDIKNIYGTYFLLIAVVIFVVIYYIINYNELERDNLFSGDAIKPILITGVILLLASLFLSDEEEEELDSINSKIYKIMNVDDQFEKFENLEQKYDNPRLEEKQNTNNEKDNHFFRIMNDKNNKNHIKHDDRYSKQINNSSSLKEKSKKRNRNVFLPYKDNTIKFALKT